MADRTSIAAIEEESVIDLYNAQQQQQAAIPPVRSIPGAPIAGIQMRSPDERECYLSVQGRWSTVLGSMRSAHEERGAELHASSRSTKTTH